MARIERTILIILIMLFLVPSVFGAYQTYDDHNDASIDANLWDTSGDVSETGGNAKMDTGGSNAATFVSDYDVFENGNSWHVRIASYTLTTGGGDQWVRVEFYQGGNNQIIWTKSTGSGGPLSLYIEKLNANTARYKEDSGSWTTFDISGWTGAFLRMRSWRTAAPSDAVLLVDYEEYDNVTYYLNVTNHNHYDDVMIPLNLSASNYTNFDSGYNASGTVYTNFTQGSILNMSINLTAGGNLWNVNYTNYNASDDLNITYYYNYFKFLDNETASALYPTCTFTGADVNSSYHFFTYAPSDAVNVSCTHVGYAGLDFTINLSESSPLFGRSMHPVTILITDIRDAISFNTITDPVDVSITSLIHEENKTTSTGEANFTDIPCNAEYKIRVDSANYATNFFFVYLSCALDSEEIVYLFPNNASVNLTFFIKDNNDRNLENALIQCRKYFNNSWIVVAEQISDFSGQGSLPAYPETTNYCNVSKEGYLTRDLDFIPASPYEYYVWLISEIGIDFSYLLDGIFYNYTPTDYYIPSRVTNFTLTTSSPPGFIGYFGVYSTINATYYSNQTVNAYGGTSTITVNLTNVTGDITVTYYIVPAGASTWSYSVVYTVGLVEPGRSSFLGWTSRYKDQFSEKTRAVIALVTSIILIAALVGFGIPAVPASIVGIFGLFFWAFAGWLSMWIIGLLLILIVGGVFIFSRGGAV